MSHKKVEVAFEEYMAQIADFEPVAKASLAEEERIKRDNTDAIAALKA